MTEQSEVFLRVQRRDDGYHVSWSADPARGYHEVGVARIGPSDTIDITTPDEPHAPVQYTIGDLIHRLLDFRAADRDLFRERGQTTLGNHLFEETIGRVGHLRDADRVHLRIQPLGDSGTDDHVVRLPWPLLARDSILRSNTDTGWCYSILTQPDALTDVELSPTPRMLMITPEPRGVGATGHEDHLQEIQRALRTWFPKIPARDRLRHVRSWEEFQDAAAKTHFDLVYYYGHGEGDQTVSRLLFEDSDGQPTDKPFAAVADALCVRDERPTIVYINCCLGDAGGSLGAGHQLSRTAPCVVTNRTFALVDVACKQALAFWEQVLRYGQPPHIAVASLCHQPEAIGVSRTDVHWFTPVMHASYRNWKARQAHVDREIDQHWDLNLDRIPQFSELSYLVRGMAREQDRDRKSLAFIWFGEPGQGMRLFHDRVEVKLEEELDDRVRVYRPRWPDTLEYEGFPNMASSQWAEKLAEVFAVQRIEDVAAKLRTDARQERVILLSFPHVPQRRLVSMNPKRLLDFLHWWDDHFLRLQPTDDRQFVLAFSFECSQGKANQFRSALERDYSGVEFHRLVVRRLAPLGSIVRQDLSDFLDLHNVYIDPRERPRILDEIMNKTDGHYETTLQEMEEWIRKGYPVSNEGQEDAPVEPGEGYE